MADLVASVMLVLVVQASILPPSLSSTHWVVTEDGMVTQHLDSVFNLRKPYDLIEFIRQAERSESVHALQTELLNQKIQIDENDDKSDTNIEQQYYDTDGDCMIAEKPLPEYDLYTSTVVPLENKGIDVEEHIDLNAKLPKKLKQPNCSTVLELPFSIHAFEHLKGVQYRKNISDSAEPGLRGAITYKDDTDEFGHLIYKALQRNKTSWVLYNLAAYYWRIKGNSYQVIECCRRALHFSPREHKDVALVNMANVLHRARHSPEAAVLIHASLDISTDLNVNHFTLGNIYAVLGEYNRSVMCFEQTAHQQPDFEAAQRRKHAVLCQEKLEAALEEQHENLQHTLAELKEYQRKHEHFQEQRKQLLDLQQMTEVQFELNIKYQQQRLKDGVGETQKCQINDEDGRQVLVCKKELQPESEAYGTIFTEKQIVASDDRDPDIECLKRASGAENDCFNVHHLAEEEVIDVPEATEDIKPQPNPNAEYRDKDWPKKTDCDMNYKGLPVWREYQSTYLPPENKGFHVKPLLTEDLGLVSGPGEEHPLPWYPPVCVHVDDLSGVVTSVDSLNGIANRERIPIKMPDHNVKKILLSLVNDGDVTEEEVGQRILTALKENKESKWILYHLAGLYWRVIGNNYHGVECLRRSIYFAPEEYLDVPLVNLANILLRVGSYKDAATLLKRAVDVNHAEAVSHFTYGNALAAQVNYSGAAHEYITTLDLDSNFELAFKTLHTIKCHEKFHCAAKGSSDDSSGDPSMCQRPPSTSTSSQTERRIVCHHVQGVEQCQMETRQRRISPEEAGCPGICTTTCTSHPPKDMCGGQEPTPCNGCSGNKRCHSCSQTEEGKGFQCHTGPVPPHQCITDALEIIEIDEDDLNQIEDLEESLELLAPVAKALSDEQHTINLKSSDMEGKKMVTVNVKASSTSTKNKKTSSDNATKKKGKENSNNDGENNIEEADDLFLIIDSTEYSWPTLEECKNLKKINVQGFTSTWLSVTAKEVDLHEHINFRMNIPDGVLMEPFCEAALGPSLFTLDHLKGLVERDQIDYSAEQGLKEVLQTLSGEHENYEIVGTRIALGLTSNQSSWVLANMAALYWRVEGEGEKSLDCLRQALTFSPRPMKDIALISMANIFHRAGLFEDALVVTGMALEISPDLVVNHFTMANIYAAMGNYIEALKYYETTLLLQEGFQPALERMKTIQCHIQQSSNKK